MSTPQHNQPYMPPTIYPTKQISVANKVHPEDNLNNKSFHTKGKQEYSKPDYHSIKMVTNQQHQDVNRTSRKESVIELAASDSGKTNEKKLLPPGNKHEDKSSKYSDNDMVASEESKGLPNIGNNCFLNSAIQLLFTAEKFRRMLIKKYHRNAKNMSKNENSRSPSFLLGALFFHLEKKGDFVDEKKILLKNFLVCLSQLNLHYEMYRQEDAFETLNNLLCNLDYSEEEREEIRGLFEVVTEMQCQCMPEPMRIASMYAKTDPQTCETCRQHFKTKTVSFPVYLLVSQNRHTSKQLNRGGIPYQLACNMIYYGNGKSGHYIVNIYKEEKKTIISDFNVTSRKIEDTRNIGEPCFCQVKVKHQNYADPNSLFSLFIRNQNQVVLEGHQDMCYQGGCCFNCLSFCCITCTQKEETITEVTCFGKTYFFGRKSNK